MSRNAKVNQVILIILDDVRATHLFELLEKLPNMAQLVKEGISCQNCITSFPSITFPCYSNLMVGAYSGYYPKEGSGIPNYHWVARTDPPSEGNPPSEGKRFPFIRNYGEGRQLWQLGKDLGTNVHTIFEQADCGNFLSSLNVVYRGSEVKIPFEFKSELIFKTVEDAFKNPGDFFLNKEVPRISVIYIPETDELMHHKGFDHPDYINEIINCDKYLGSLLKTLKDTGYYDDAAICIVSDHGNYRAQNMYDLEPFFQEKGFIQYIPKKGTGDFDAEFGSIGFFNFPGDNWHHHPTIKQMQNFKPSGIGSKKLNLFEVLWKIPGVKLMYYRDDNNTPERGIIYLERKDQTSGKISKGQIEYEGHGKKQKTKYTFENQELFGYEKNEEASNLLDDKAHTIDEWLASTHQIDYPYFIDQLPRYFKNPHACDIMISTCGEYGFGFEHGKTTATYPYNHDIALKKSMTVPLIIGGSGVIPNFELNYCKTTDVVPTLLDLLGIKPHWSVVGDSILNQK